MRPSVLHPDHLADLRKSGLTDESIQAAGVYTVPPDEVGKTLGGLANGVVSALAFPYPGYDGFERYKVWREETANYSRVDRRNLTTSPPQIRT